MEIFISPLAAAVRVPATMLALCGSAACLWLVRCRAGRFRSGGAALLVAALAMLGAFSRFEAETTLQLIVRYVWNGLAFNVVAIALFWVPFARLVWMVWTERDVELGHYLRALVATWGSMIVLYAMAVIAYWVVAAIGASGSPFGSSGPPL